MWHCDTKRICLMNYMKLNVIISHINPACHFKTYSLFRKEQDSSYTSKLMSVPVFKSVYINFFCSGGYSLPQCHLNVRLQLRMVEKQQKSVRLKKQRLASQPQHRTKSMLSKLQTKLSVGNTGLTLSYLMPLIMRLVKGVTEFSLWIIKH